MFLSIALANMLSFVSTMSSTQLPYSSPMHNTMNDGLTDTQTVQPHSQYPFHSLIVNVGKLRMAMRL